MQEIERLRSEFLKYLEQESFRNEPHNLYEPNNYFLQIGGKRLRPVLLLLTTELFGGDVNEALPASLAVEYFHNFTLIHDDVMDNAPLRRNFETIHKKYNLNTAILSGDVLFVKACEYLGKVNQKYFKTVYDVYIKTAIEVCEGQQYDVDFETQSTVTHADYTEMIRLKTSVLLAASMQIGAILGGAEHKDAEAIYHYAENLGIAFQIQDDILDVYGDEKLVGKQPGGDILQNKKTLLMIEALKRSQSAGDTNLENILAQKGLDNNEKINQVKMIFDQYDIKVYGLSIRDCYIEQSLSALAQIDLSTAKKEVLLQLVNLLVKRDF